MDEQLLKGVVNSIVRVHKSGNNPPQNIRFEQTKNLFRKTYREAAGVMSPRQGQQPVLRGKPHKETVPEYHSIIM